MVRYINEKDRPTEILGRTGTGEFNRATDVSARFNRGNGNARQTIPTKDITNNFYQSCWAHGSNTALSWGIYDDEGTRVFKIKKF